MLHDDTVQVRSHHLPHERGSCCGGCQLLLPLVNAPVAVAQVRYVLPPLVLVLGILQQGRLLTLAPFTVAQIHGEDRLDSGLVSS